MKQSSLYRTAITVNGAAGTCLSLYSLRLRELAEQKIINYTYMQGVGIHWGVSMIAANVCLRFGVKPINAAIGVSAWSTFSEGMQLFMKSSTTYSSRATLEDVVGGIGGAIIGAYLPTAVEKVFNYTRKKPINEI